MASRWFAHPRSGHHVAGYCCVFVAACYLTAIILLVGYLMSGPLW
jgi:hypothetical protein